MNITDANTQRRKIGIQLFCEDLDSIIYYDVTFHIEKRGERKTLCVTAGSDRLPENTTRAMAIEHIFRAKSILQMLKEESRDFSQYVYGLEVIIRFVYDHGKWCTLLAQEESGTIQWVF